jgi:small subunit ribosomal protein S16
MALRIRLSRTGKRNAPHHRIVVADARSPRDGRFIEVIGIYDPRHKSERIDLERVDYWLPRGAKPSETVDAIIKRARAGVPMGSDKAAGKEAEKDVAEEAVRAEETEPEEETAEDEAAEDEAAEKKSEADEG